MYRCKAVDIVFLIDATGDMTSAIGGLKIPIMTFITPAIEGLKDERNGFRHWRSKVVGYRDFIYDAVPIEDNPFVESADELYAQFDKLEAKGGGDEPESLLEGIYHVASMEETGKGHSDSDLNPNKWRYKHDAKRAVIIFTASSYHEEMEEPKGGTIEDVATICHDNCIALYIFAPDLDCYDEIKNESERRWRKSSELGWDFGCHLYLFPYDEYDEEGAVEGLIKFTNDSMNLKECLWHLLTPPPLIMIPD